MRNRRRGPRLPALLDELDDRCLLIGLFAVSAGRIHASPDHGRLWLECDHLHVVSRAPRSKGNGTGETIALIEMYHDPNIQSDLATFDAKYNLPDSTLTGGEPGGQPDR